jgi:hypothetical protein
MDETPAVKFNLFLDFHSAHFQAGAKAGLLLYFRHASAGCAHRSAENGEERENRSSRTAGPRVPGDLLE